MASSAQILVDDGDARIRYSSNGWIVSGAIEESSRLFPDTVIPTYRITSHRSNNFNSSLSFSFEGTSIVIYGFAPDSKTECFLDNISIGRVPRTMGGPDDPDNLVICKQDFLKDGSHTVTVTTNSYGSLWFDYLLYTPSPQASFDKVNLIMKNNDPSISFDSNWRTLNDSFKVTNVPGAHAKLNFTGTSVTWVVSPLLLSIGMVRFSIDGGPYKTIELPPFPRNMSTSVNLFTTGIVPPGPHSASAVYRGTIDGGPPNLMLYHLYITDAAINWPPTATILPTVVILPTISGTGSDSPHHTSSSTSIGAIVGGAIGGIALIATFICLLILLRRHQHYRIVGGLIPGLSGTGPSLIPFTSTPALSQQLQTSKRQLTENANALALHTPFTKSPVIRYYITRNPFQNQPLSRPSPRFHRFSAENCNHNMPHAHSTSTDVPEPVAEVEEIQNVQASALVARQDRASSCYPPSAVEPPPSYASV